MKIARCSAAVLFAAAGPALAAAPAPSDLLRIVFPGWEAAPPQTVTLHAGAGGWGTGQPQTVLLDPKVVLSTSEDSLTLVSGMVPAGGDGRASAAHVTPMGLSAYRFTRAGGHWTLAAREEGFGYAGYFGQAQVRSVALSAQTAGIEVETGSCWQGYCGRWMKVFQLEDGLVKPRPVAALALDGHNYYSSGDCVRRLQPLIQLAPGDDVPDPVPPESHSCFKISGTWSIAASGSEEPGDLTVHFAGAISPAAKQPTAQAVDQALVLRYRDGEYRVVSGTNPVPQI